MDIIRITMAITAVDGTEATTVAAGMAAVTMEVEATTRVVAENILTDNEDPQVQMFTEEVPANADQVLLLFRQVIIVEVQLL